jgi:hypothetical protein
VGIGYWDAFCKIRNRTDFYRKGQKAQSHAKFSLIKFVKQIFEALSALLGKHVKLSEFAIGKFTKQDFAS